MAQYQEVFQGKRQRFLIRSAVGADAPALVRYMSLVNRETTFLSMEPGEFERIFPVEREAQLLEEWAASHYHLSLLALTEDGEIAGSCNCAYSTEKQRYRHRASLGLSVRQDFWRQGLGRRLLEVQQAWCRSQGITKLCLEVDTVNTAALGLYLRLGFEVEGTLRREVKMADGSYRDLYVMGKFLDEDTAFPG